jgi:aspartyl/asparaginyl beta-hydroxylase (cupin superfamily)
MAALKARSRAAKRGGAGAQDTQTNTRILAAVLVILAVFSLAELTPYFVTAMFPHLSYGSTVVGETHQQLNRYGFSYLNWVCFMLLVLVLVYLCVSQITRRDASTASIVLYAGCALALLWLLYVVVFPLLNIINLVLCLGLRNPPILSTEECYAEFPPAQEIEANYEAIRKEYDAYDKHKASCIRESNPGFTIEMTKTPGKCWRMILLKKLGKCTEEARLHFPTAYACLQDNQIHNAFFSILDPGVQIPGHIGYYKGYLRYHMGVVIPESSDGGPYIVCGGQKYHWKEGEGVMFDDMNYHYVRNPTDQTRVVMYIDVYRNDTTHGMTPFLKFLNDVGIAYISNSVLLSRYLESQHAQVELFKERMCG